MTSGLLLNWKLPVSYSSQRPGIRMGGKKHDQSENAGD